TATDSATGVSAPRSCAAPRLPTAARCGGPPLIDHLNSADSLVSQLFDRSIIEKLCYFGVVTRHREPEAHSQVARLNELAQRLMSVSVWTGRYLDPHFAQLGLDPAGARALLHLDPDHAVPTRYLAERLCCDPSNVTAPVDRLESSGLIRRQTDPEDRRVKALTMTAKGRRVRAAMAEIIATQPPSLTTLTAEEQETLLRLLNKAWAACQAHDASRRPSATPSPRNRNRSD